MNRKVVGALMACLWIGGAEAVASASWGWVEKGEILPVGTRVKMKLDTGALTSSLDARNLTRFKRDGKNWVRFNVVVTDADSGKLVKHQFERPVERNVTVRGAGGQELRPMVTMSICLGDKVYEEWFTLRDRSNMIYPVLIGRRLLAELGPVDSNLTFTRQPRCR